MANVAPPAAKPRPTDRVGDVIAKVATSLGVPVEVALADAYYESKMNPLATGDRGFFRGGVFVSDPAGPPTSFGEYQLHKGGELGDMPPSTAFDVFTNASTALPHFAAARRANPHATWGQVAAAAQRPADQAGYATAIDSLLNGYHHSGMHDPVAYFATLPGSWGGVDDTNAQEGHRGNVAPGGTPGTSTNGDTNAGAAALTGPKADDWISGLDAAMSPKLGWNPLKDTGSVIKFAMVRGGIALVGVVLIGTGLVLMFGREIFGGLAVAVAPEVALPAEAASAAASSAGRRADHAAKAAVAGG